MIENQDELDERLGLALRALVAQDGELLERGMLRSDPSPARLALN